MKIMAVLMCFVGLLSSFGKSYSQNTKLSIELKNSTIENVLNYIESRTEYSFMYDNKKIDISREVSINVKDQTVESILDQLFENGVNYQMIGKHIIITQKESQFSNATQQSHSISGKVTDSGGQPLPGVSVVVKGTSAGVITDANGNYKLANVPSNAIMKFSFVGMKTKEINVGGKSTINIMLEEEAVGIEEVVAVGYGVQKKVNLTGAVANVSSKELAQRPVSNLGQLLEGKLSGVTIYQTSAEPGSEGININIRGMNSYGTSNAPIVLVDGIEGDLASLNPENIESVSVLKDASSSAIYGSRAANGVILVTTKRGKAGTFNLTYHSNFAIHRLINMPSFVNDPVEYMQMFNVAATNSSFAATYPKDVIEKYSNGEIKGFNWDKAVYKQPMVQTHNITATGGTEKIRYNLGLGYLDQDGTIIGFNYKKYNVSLNFDSDINKYISFGGNIKMMQGNRKGTYNGSTDMLVAIYTSAPDYPAKLPDGKYVYHCYSWEINANKNPVALAENGGAWTDNRNVLSQAYLKVKPLKGLVWETNGAVNFYHTYSKTRGPVVPIYFYPSGQYASDYPATDYLNVSQNFSDQYTLSSTLNYTKSIKEDHHLNVLAGYSQENFRYDVLGGYRTVFPNNIMNELNAGGTQAQTTSGTATEWALRSYFTRVNYNYKEKYIIEFNLRRDGSSRFYKDDRYSIFPSLSAAWRISEENFAKNIAWFPSLKLRGSYGELGNQLIGNYPYQSMLSLGNDYSFNNSTTSPGAVQTKLANQNISWETTTVKDYGCDMNVKNGLFTLTFDYFDKTTSDILRTSQIMGYVGLTAPTVNSGQMQNKGYDFTVGHQHKIGEVGYGVNINFSHYKNMTSKFGPQQISDVTIIKEGIPLSSWYLYQFDGIFQSAEDIASSPKHFYTPTPGDIKLKDTNGDGVVNSNDRVVMKGRYPDFTYGVHFNIEWKNLSFSAFVQGVQGIKVFKTNWGAMPFYQGARPTVEWKNAWTPENHSNALPKLYLAQYYSNNSYYSSYFLQDASYARLKNVQIGYSFPKSILGRIGIEGARVYLSGDNLLTITKYKDGDPENSPNNTNLISYPQEAIYSFGVELKF